MHPSSCSACAPLYLDQRVYLQSGAWLDPPQLHSACPEPTPLTTDAANNPLKPPSGVSRYGEYETAPIQSPLDNHELFEITSPTILNRNNVPEGMLPVEVRAEDVNQRLFRALLRVISAKQTPTVTIDTLNNSPIIQISDDQSTGPVRLVTVTEPDADFNGKISEELAREWQKILQDEVTRFKQLFTREVLLQRLGQVCQILLGLLIASAVTVYC